MISILQHISFESPGLILDWLELNEQQYNLVKIYEKEALPHPQDIECLIIMGGPMNVNEENRYPWLKEEKELIRKLIDSGKKVLGICLGSQMISSALGYNVRRNPASEIGWFSIDINVSRLPIQFADVFPEHFVSFQWHGDTFEIPASGSHFATSEACTNQGFFINDNVLAMQFHLEMDEKCIEELFENCSEELLSESVFVQSAEEIRRGMKHIEENKKILFKLLSGFILDGNDG